MELIALSGYTEEEKLEIAKRHIVPRALLDHGLGGHEVQIPVPTLRRLISDYTREAGLRNLERQVAAVCRKVARKVAEGDDRAVTVTAARLPALLGPPRAADHARTDQDEIGVVTGLAWTQAGGDVLQIEATPMPGTGALKLTGQLGEVMKESAHAAMTWVRSRSEQLGIDPQFFRERELHVHVPAGAIPKDGPSAGVTLATALASVATGIPVRRDVAMTGEVTLRGHVLAVGGIREKLLAAVRAGLRTVILPAANAPDLVELHPAARRKIRIVLVRHVDEVLREALVQTPTPRPKAPVEARPPESAGVC
jgi:ATP-dependent Lon protease